MINMKRQYATDQDGAEAYREDNITDPLYHKFAGEIKRRKQLSFLGPLLTFIFAQFIIGVNFKIPALFFLQRRIFSEVFALVVCILYYIINRTILEADEELLEQYLVSKVVPRDLERGQSYRRTQLVSAVMLVILLVGIVYIQKPQTLAEQSYKDTDLPIEELKERYPSLQTINLSSISSIFAPKQFQFVVDLPDEGEELKISDISDKEQQKEVSDEEISNEVGSNIGNLNLDIFQLYNESAAANLFAQMDNSAETEMVPVKGADEEPYQSYEGKNLKEGATVKYKTYTSLDDNEGKFYYILAHKGDVALSAYYAGARDIEELVDITQLFLIAEKP